MSEKNLESLRTPPGLHHGPPLGHHKISRPPPPLRASGNTLPDTISFSYITITIVQTLGVSRRLLYTKVIFLGITRLLVVHKESNFD